VAPAPAAPVLARPAPATGAPATSDALTTGQVGALNRAGLANIATDIVKNPGRYSAHDRQMIFQRGKELAP
jgi:hypothetical protein